MSTDLLTPKHRAVIHTTLAGMPLKEIVDALAVGASVLDPRTTLTTVFQELLHLLTMTGLTVVCEAAAR